MRFSSLLDYCESQQGAMLRCLRKAVEIESPSGSRPALERMAAFCAAEFERLGGTVRLRRVDESAPAVLAEFWSRRRRRKPVLVLGHIDTVWGLGSLSRMPFRIAKGAVFGPGVLDMKSGLICGLWAIRALRQFGISLPGPARFFLNPEEETGSHTFRPLIEHEAKRSCACLVLEPAAEGGALKTARKGVAEFHLVVRGRAAHAGIAPASGVNAITELARQLLRVELAFQKLPGVTVNPGVIEGGTRPNVVPECASATVDVRFPRQRDQAFIEREMYGMRSFNRQARLIVSGGANRPPMEKREAASLFRKARKLGQELGIRLSEASTGGGSDGNFTAALGIPTLDGLGGVGGGAHAAHEHVVIEELPRRAALLAALLVSV